MFQVNPANIEKQFLQDIGNQGLENACMEVVTTLCVYIRELQDELKNLKEEIKIGK